MRKNITQFLLIIGIVGVFTLQSCEGAYDFDMSNFSDSLTVNPALALPLANGSITLEDVMPTEGEDTFIEVDTDGLIHFVFEKQIGGYAATEYFGDHPLIGPTLPEITYTVSPQRLDLGLSAFALDGEFYLGNPQFEFTIKNEWAISVEFLFSDFKYYNKDGVSASVTGTFIDSYIPINAPVVSGDVAETSIKIDGTNSNVSDLIAAFPEYVTFGGAFKTIAGSSYEVNIGDSVILDMTMDIPMDFRLTDLTIIDTMEFTFDEVADQIESANLRLNIDNGFPLNIKAQAYLTDANYVILDSLYSQGLFEINQAATQAGVVTSSTNSQLIFSVDANTLTNLGKTKFLLFKVVLNTDGNTAGETVKILTNYNIGLDVSLDAKFIITNN